MTDKTYQLLTWPLIQTKLECLIFNFIMQLFQQIIPNFAA